MTHRPALKRKGTAMQSVPTEHNELKTPSKPIEHRPGFESVGVILRRLFQRKGELEACMTPTLDRRLSLDLDAVTAKIDALWEERSA
jgi:hypothetical protein